MKNNIYLYILIFVIIISIILVIVLSKRGEKYKHSTEKFIPTFRNSYPNNMRLMAAETTTTMMPTTTTTMLPTTTTTMLPTTTTTMMPTTTTMMPTTTTTPPITTTTIPPTLPPPPVTINPKDEYDAKLEDYVGIIKGTLGRTVNLLSSTISSPNIANGNVIVHNDEKFTLNNYIGVPINYSNVEETTSSTTRDYVYTLTTNTDADASFDTKFVSGQAEMNLQTGRNIKKDENIQVLSYNFVNKFYEISLDQGKMFTNIFTDGKHSATNGISGYFIDAVKNLVNDAKKYNRLIIPDPQNLDSWNLYKGFISTWGSHLITNVVLGNKFSVNYSSTYTSTSDASSLKLAACAKISGNDGTYKGSVKVCTDVDSTKKEKQSVKDVNVTYLFYGVGQERFVNKKELNEEGKTIDALVPEGRDKAPTDLPYEGNTLKLAQKMKQTPVFDLVNDTQLLFDFMQLGKLSPGIMDYRYEPIWNIILNFYSMSDPDYPALIQVARNLENSYQFDTKYSFNNYDYYEIPAGETTYKLKCKYSPPSLSGGVINGYTVDDISSDDIVVGNPYPFMKDNAFEYNHSPERKPPIILTDYLSRCGGSQVYDDKFGNAGDVCEAKAWTSSDDNACKTRGGCFQKGSRVGLRQTWNCDQEEDCNGKYNFRGNLVKIVRLPGMANDQFIINYVQSVKDHSKKLYYLSMNDAAAKTLNEQNGGGTGINQQAVCLRITDDTTPATATTPAIPANVAAYSKWKMDTSGRIHLVLQNTDNYCLKAVGRELHLVACDYRTFSDETGFYLSPATI